MYADINTLFGYETGTLAYTSEYKNIETYSLLKKIKNGSKYLELVYELYIDEFKNIKFID